MDIRVKRANLVLFRQMIAEEPDDIRRRQLEDVLNEEEALFEASLHEDAEENEEPARAVASAR